MSRFAEYGSEEGLFRDLLESAPDAMVIANADGEIVLVNSQTENLFGYSRDELLGQPVEILIPHRFRGRHPSHRRGYAKHPRWRPMSEDRYLYGMRRDGSEFPVEISLSPLQTEKGLLTSSAVRDVTERRRAEEELQETNAALERASQAKDKFLASMSHELRTPLNAIIGFTGTLLMKLPGPLNDEQENQLRTVQASGKHLLSLINDLLDLAKIESGKVEVALEPVDCRSVVEDVLATLRPMANARNLKMSSTVPVGDVSVMADRRALTQILLNLTNNAIRFTHSGGVAITVTRSARNGNAQVKLSVKDTGVGIKDEDKGKVFEAFARIDPQQNSTSEGTGLGLHLSDRLAHLLGGQISFSSTYGKGSTFVLTLPGS